MTAVPGTAPPRLPYAALAYGCHWKSAFPLPLFHPTAPPRVAAEVCISLAAPDAPPRSHHLAKGRLRFCADGLRYLADEDVVLDVYGTDRIEVTPGPGWNGALPAGLYGSTTGALLATRGELVMHGSAVALDGRALLICGNSGSGKSTMTAALLSAGAQLLSDDLSAVKLRTSPESPDGVPVLFPGRRALRLFPDLAQRLGATVPLQTLPEQWDHKVLVAPPPADPARAYPLAAVLILGSRLLTFSTDPVTAAVLEHSYRRRAFRRLPAHALRLEIARALAARVPVVPLAPVEARDQASFRRVAEAALQAYEKAAAARS